MSSPGLFEQPDHGFVQPLGPGACVLRGFALPCADRLLADLRLIEELSPFRHMVTPGGFPMSVALTNCGTLGWTTDRSGYRYTKADPESNRPWPEMPEVLVRLAQKASETACFGRFSPDACLVNRYVPGARLALHQDRNERDFAAPIVSVSLGMTAIFLFGGLKRSDPVARLPLYHADVVVWGGEDRLRYHGVLPLTGESHPVLGNRRINFTLRKAG